MPRDEVAQVHDFSALPIQTERRSRNKIMELWQSGLSFGKLQEPLEEHIISVVGGKGGGESWKKILELDFWWSWTSPGLQEHRALRPEASVGAEPSG